MSHEYDWDEPLTCSDEEWERRERIRKLPRIYFYHGKSWDDDLGFAVTTVRWSRNLDAEDGDYLYRRQLSIRWSWPRIRLEGNR